MVYQTFAYWHILLYFQLRWEGRSWSLHTSGFDVVVSWTEIHNRMGNYISKRVSILLYKLLQFGSVVRCKLRFPTAADNEITENTFAKWFQEFAFLLGNRTALKWLSKTNSPWKHVFFLPRFEQVTGNCLEFWLVHRAVCSCYDWSELLLWYWLFDGQLKTSLLCQCMEIRIKVGPPKLCEHKLSKEKRPSRSKTAQHLRLFQVPFCAPRLSLNLQ